VSSQKDVGHDQMNGRGAKRQGLRHHVLQSLVVCLAWLCVSHVVWAQTTLESKIEGHFLAAKEAEKKGDYETAVGEYRAVLKLDPDLAEVRSNLGLILYVQRKDKEAITAFEQALKRKPDLLAPNLFLGMAFVRTNQYEKAIEPLKTTISLNPAETRAYANLGLSYLELGREQDALKVLQKAAELWPQDVEILYNLGVVYTRLMTTTYRKMAQIDPDSHRVHQLLGASFEARRDTRRAIEEYKLAIEKKPGLAGLHYALGNLYWKEGDLEKAAEEFLKELEIAPENYLTTWKLGNIYLLNKQYDLAFQYLEKAIQQKPDLGQAHRDLGRALIQTDGDLQRAITHLTKVIQLSPEEPTSHYLLAQIYKKLGRRVEQSAELEIFERLRKVQREKEQSARTVVSPGEDEKNEDFPEVPDVPR
jgi:tetratricopeptide (TPR) repeat protein